MEPCFETIRCISHKRSNKNFAYSPCVDQRSAKENSRERSRGLRRCTLLVKKGGSRYTKCTVSLSIPLRTGRQSPRRTSGSAFWCIFLCQLGQDPKKIDAGLML